MATTTVSPNPTGSRNPNNPAWDTRKKNYIYWIAAGLVVLAVIVALSVRSRDVAPQVVAPATVTEPVPNQNLPPGTTIEKRTESTTTSDPN